MHLKAKQVHGDLLGLISGV